MQASGRGEEKECRHWNRLFPLLLRNSPKVRGKSLLRALWVEHFPTEQGRTREWAKLEF